MRRRIEARSTPPPSDGGPASSADATQRTGVERLGLTAPEPVMRALVWGTVVAGVGALVLGLLKVWIWIIALEPIALGFVLGEVAAVPSSARHRRPPAWTYLYLFALACLTYALVHVVFWLASEGFPPDQSFLSFLRSAPSATATPLIGDLQLVQWTSSAGGPSSIKYLLWLAEGLLMAIAAALAYRGGSVRQLKS